MTDREIRSLRILLENSSNISVNQIDFELGEYIEINSGPFCGYKGEIAKIKNSDVLIVRLDFMATIVSFEITINLSCK